jgi:hypothetical protein
MDLVRFTERNCLHKTERLAKTLANHPFDAFASIVKDLIYIERFLVWESSEMQKVFSEIVNSVGHAIAGENNNNNSDMTTIQTYVTNLLAYIQKNNPSSRGATPNQVDFYARKLKRIKQRVERIQSILKSHTFDNHIVQAVGIRYNEINNMCCNAYQWLKEVPPNRIFLKKIFNILESRISDLENECTLWDRVVDTVAEVFVSSHNRRCFRRSSTAV